METLTPTTDVEASIQNGERRYTRTPFQHSNIKQCPSYKRFTPDANGKNQQKQHLLPWLRSCSTLQPLTPQGKSFFPYPHMCTLSSPPEGSGFFIGAPALGDQGSFFPYPHMCTRAVHLWGMGFFRIPLVLTLNVICDRRTDRRQTTIKNNVHAKNRNILI